MLVNKCKYIKILSFGITCAVIGSLVPMYKLDDYRYIRMYKDYKNLIESVEEQNNTNLNFDRSQWDGDTLSSSELYTKVQAKYPKDNSKLLYMYVLDGISADYIKLTKEELESLPNEKYDYIAKPVCIPVYTDKIMNKSMLSLTSEYLNNTVKAEYVEKCLTDYDRKNSKKYLLKEYNLNKYMENTMNIDNLYAVASNSDLIKSFNKLVDEIPIELIE